MFFQISHFIFQNVLQIQDPILFIGIVTKFNIPFHPILTEIQLHNLQEMD